MRFAAPILLLLNILIGNDISAQNFCKSGRGDSMRDADAAALDPRSDSINIRHYTINLDFSNMPQPGIQAACTVDFEALVDGITHITLDLEGLTVDSVVQGQAGVAFTHVGSKLHILLSQQLNTGEASDVTVYYQGMPVEDASGFGGFSFSGSCAYNIGVGFEADPHNFGRVWFPCFDNFVERSTYTCIVKMPENYRAYCGGMLVSNAVESGFRTMVWDLNQEVPSYLASVAVAPPRTVDDLIKQVKQESVETTVNQVLSQT